MGGRRLGMSMGIAMGVGTPGTPRRRHHHRGNDGTHTNHRPARGCNTLASAIDHGNSPLSECHFDRSLPELESAKNV
jgi:hypothetical protein